MEVVKQAEIPKNKAVLFLANHQNALLDALLIATTCGRFSYFLTRAAVFKKPWVSKLLHTLRMLPVYRIRDGWSNLTQNNSIFNTCTDLLHEKEAVAIFPEGSHNLNRTVRPLSKGFTRIITETLERYPETDLHLVPIGFNFQKAEGFPDQVSIYYGTSFSVKDITITDKNQLIQHLKTRVHDDITNLTSHIPSDGYESTLKKLEAMGADFTDPVAVNRCISNDFTDCHFNKESGTLPLMLMKLFHLLFICNMIVPYIIWKWMIKPKIVEIEFRSTFRFALAITLGPLWLLLSCYIVFSVFGWGVTLMYFLIALALTLIRVKA